MRLPAFSLFFAAAALSFAADPAKPASAPSAEPSAAPATPKPKKPKAETPKTADKPKPADVPATDTTAPKPAAPKKPLTVKIEMRDGLRFEPPRFAAAPGQEIVVSLENADTTHQQHNFLVVQPGKLKEVVQQSLELGEKGPKQEFIPENPAIMIHSSVLDPEKVAEVRFTLPAEKGVYPFVCSMPGHGMVMYGAIYAGVKMPALDKDPNIPPMAAQRAIVGGGQRPYVQRIFMPDAGPAAIAVALPDQQNFCWDAGECRLRYAWRGAFIDAGANWRGNGKDLPVVSAPPWWSAEKGAFPLRFGAAEAGPAPAVKFLGYTMGGGLPEFRYRVGDTEVFEKITGAPDNAGLLVHFRIPKAAQPVAFSIAPGPANAQWTSSAGEIKGGVLQLTAAQAADFTITLTQPETTHQHKP